MARCKECLHYDVCSSITGLLPRIILAGDKAEERCGIFKSTADVVEVKRGEWIGIEGDQCSICNRYISEIMDADSYYAIGFEPKQLVACPFCGGKMNGGETDAE